MKTKTIKIIDLLNMIANDEEVPEKIKYKNEIWEYYKDLTNYIRPGKPNTLFTMYYIHKILNEEVEIIEKEKEIEKIFDIELLGQCDNWLQKRDVNIKSDFELNPYILEAITRNFKLLYHKQCELIDAVNEMRKEK